MIRKITIQFNVLRAQYRSMLNEYLLPTIGGCASIFIVYFISFKLTDLQGASAILPSMGAIAVLLFCTPKNVTSQPWALFSGNLLSALIGVLCYQWLGDSFIAASCAVGFSILAMLLCQCIHPPGGATALAAVVGGDSIHQLGLYYVIAPTLLNCLIIFTVASVFNYYSSTRSHLH